jgi:hypothetical protein
MSKRLYIPALIVLIGVVLIVYAVMQRSSMATTPKTLNLAEFGIALTIPSSLRDVTYEAKDGSPGPATVLHMYVNGTCEVGAFYEIQKNAVGKSGTPWSKETLEQFQVPMGQNPARVKEFTDFYLVFEPSQEACSSDTKQAEEEAQKRYDLWNALSTARYMSY